MADGSASVAVSVLTPGVALASMGGVSYPAAVSVPLTSDLNEDGRSDLLWRNDDDGSVQAWLMNGLTVAQVASFTPAGTGWTPVLAGDLDADGKKDVVWKHTSGATQVWLMDGLNITQIGSLTSAGSYRIVP